MKFLAALIPALLEFIIDQIKKSKSRYSGGIVNKTLRERIREKARKDNWDV